MRASTASSSTGAASAALPWGVGAGGLGAELGLRGEPPPSTGVARRSGGRCVGRAACEGRRVGRVEGVEREGGVERGGGALVARALSWSFASRRGGTDLRG